MIQVTIKNKTVIEVDILENVQGAVKYERNIDGKRFSSVAFCKIDGKWYQKDYYGNIVTIQASTAGAVLGLLLGEYVDAQAK